MKKLMVVLAAVLVAANVGCGGGPSTFTYIARTTSDSTPHLFIVHGFKGTPQAVSIPIPQQALYVSANRQGSAVTYCYNAADGYNIFLMGTDGVEKELTHNANACEPVFSPDGKTIAYISGAAGIYGVFTMKADGTSQQPLYLAAVDTISAWLPEFAPDGKSVAFYVEVNSGAAVGTSQRVRTKDFGWPAAVASRKTVPHIPASPDPTVSGLYTMKLTDTTPTLAHETTSWWGPAVFSADGKKILFTEHDGTQWNISSVNLDGSQLTPLTTGTTTNAFSPIPYEGRILFNQQNESNSSFDIWVMDQDGKNQKLVHGTADTYESLLDSYWSND